MEISIKKNISVRDIAKDFIDNGEEGVTGYRGKLNIRPKYQREWVYNDKQRNEVIKSIENDYPLNVMYWVENGKDQYEVLDGQQRIISFCKYVTNPSFSMPDEHNYPKNFHNRDKEYQTTILNYHRFTIYVCKGSDEEVINWFQIVNVSGEPLKKQEIRNAVYNGSWVSNAKKYFSKNQGPAYRIAKKYIKGSPNRQDYLETAIQWYCQNNPRFQSIDDYMSKHRNDLLAKPLWNFFQHVVDWINDTFPKPDSTITQYLNQVAWGKIYQKYSHKKYSQVILKRRINEVINNQSIANPKNVFEYALSGNPQMIQLRLFSENDKRKIYKKQSEKCQKCGRKISFDEAAADHVKPFSKGGTTTLDNCQILCRDCNARKSDKY